MRTYRIISWIQNHRNANQQQQKADQQWPGGKGGKWGGCEESQCGLHWPLRGRWLLSPLWWWRHRCIYTSESTRLRALNLCASCYVLKSLKIKGKQAHKAQSACFATVLQDPGEDQSKGPKWVLCRLHGLHVCSFMELTWYPAPRQLTL